MSKIRQERKVYCFDSSAFITLKNSDEKVLQLPNALWDLLESMMNDGSIVSHMLVYDEIVTRSKKPDFVTKWLEGKKVSFYKKSPLQISKIPEIVSNFPGLIDEKREYEQADIWMIALAIEKSKENNLFEDTVAIVVSQENPNSSIKIPAACKFFGLRHLNLREFFDEIGVRTQLSKDER